MPTALLRRSALEAASCLKRFNDLYEIGIEDDSNDARRGVAFHRVFLDEYIPRLVRRDVPRDLALLNEAFERGIVLSRCPPNLVDEVYDLVFDYGGRFELDLAAYLDSEAQQVSDRFSWRPDIVYAWRMTDRGSVLRVTDLKTYYAILSEDAIRSEFQPQFYMRNAIDTWPGFDVYEFAMVFVRYGVTKVVEFTAKDYDALDLRVSTIMAAIEHAREVGDWPAQPGDQCRFCRLQCDAADDPRVLDRRIENVEEARIVAGRILAMRRMLGSDYAMLKAWCTTEGPLRVNGVEFAHRQSQRKRYDARETLAAIAEARAPDPPGLSFSKSSLSKLFSKRAQRAWPKLLEALEAFVRTSDKTTFTDRKVGDQSEVDEEQDQETTA